MLHDRAMAPWRLTPVAADPAEGRAQTGDAAARGGRDDGTPGLRADGESHQTGGGGRTRPRRRPARSLLGVPRVAGLLAEPHVAPGEGAQAQLGHQHRTCLVEPLDNGRVLIDFLFLKRCRAPRCRVAANREQILRPPRDTVQRAPPGASGELSIGPARLLHRALLGQGDDAVQLGIVLFQAFKIQSGELHRRNLADADEVPELGHGKECELGIVRRPRRLPGTTRTRGQRSLRALHPR